MASIKFLKEQQIVYLMDRTTDGKKNGYTSFWEIIIHTIDLENNRVFASWNGMLPRWYTKSQINYWRVSKPKS